MNKFKINNIYNECGKSLNEIIISFLIKILDNDLNIENYDAIISLDSNLK